MRENAEIVNNNGRKMPKPSGIKDKWLLEVINAGRRQLSLTLTSPVCPRTQRLPVGAPSFCAPVHLPPSQPSVFVSGCMETCSEMTSRLDLMIPAIGRVTPASSSEMNVAAPRPITSRVRVYTFPLSSFSAFCYFSGAVVMKHASSCNLPAPEH